MDVLEVQEMIRRMQIIHWVVMAINLMFCLSVMVLAKRSVGRIRKEHDSTCDQIRRDSRVEIDRLIEIISAFQNSTRIQKEYAADQEGTIENLTAQRDEHAKRILSLDDSHSQKCLELEAKSQELDGIKQRYSEVWRFFNLNESIITNQTFQPKRPEDQPPKPMCDN